MTTKRTRGGKKEKDNHELSVYDYVGKLNTEDTFFKKGVKSVIIRIGKEEALLIRPPYTWFEEQNDRSLFDKFISEKKKEGGWKFCASWGYYFFTRPITHKIEADLEIEVAPKSN